MMPNRPTALCALAVIVFPWSTLSAQLQPIWASAQPQRIVIQETKHDISPPLRSMPRNNTPSARFKVVEADFEPPPPVNRGVAVDPVLQKSQNILQPVRAPLRLNFRGLSAGAGGAGVVAPPDTNGAVGLTQYVQWVNLAFGVYDGTGALIDGPFAGNSLWTGFGGDCENLDSGDPMVVYDKIADRWVLSQFAINNNTSMGSQCVAVSTTPDATGTYARYQFSYGTGFNDYPKMGVWPDAYYVSYNLFDFTTFTYRGPLVCAMDRLNMIAGLAATQVCFALSSNFFSLLPADMDGTIQPPKGTPEIFMAQDSQFSPSTSLYLWRFHVDFVNTTNSTFTGPNTLSVASYSDPCLNFFRGACVPQPGTGNLLESLNLRLMHRLVWRMAGGREELLAAHTIVAGASTGIRWYEIRNATTAPIVFQQGTFAPDSSYRWTPSIAMDSSGNIALGYSVSDAGGTFPSIRYTGRLRTELLNTMETEATIQPGLGSQVGSLHRWGDYSAMTLDPADNCTFVYTNQYQPATGSFNWTSRIASFKFPNCVPQTPPCPPYVCDDGTTENAIGVYPPGSSVLWLNGFTVQPGLQTIIALSLTFGRPTFNGSNLRNGQPVTIYLWSDPNGDGNPSDAKVLRSVSALTANVDTNTFNVFPITPITLPVGTNFFVGAILTEMGGRNIQVPGSIDLDSPHGNSWIRGWAPGLIPDPNNIGPTINLSNTDVPGVFMIRAIAQ